MSDNNEYNNLVNKKNNAQAQYNSSMDRIEEYEYLLRRLRPVKETVSTQKENMKNLRNRHKDIVNRKTEWEGSTYTTLGSHLSSITYENNYYFNQKLDSILDSLNDEITRIENERMKEKGVLGHLGSLINSLTNEIENFFN